MSVFFCSVTDRDLSATVEVTLRKTLRLHYVSLRVTHSRCYSPFDEMRDRQYNTPPYSTKRERCKNFASKNGFHTMKTSVGVLAVRQVSLKKYGRRSCRARLQRLPSRRILFISGQKIIHWVYLDSVLIEL